MSLKEVGFAASTIWVILAAILVIFMQAGFAFLEAGLTRMKNVGHIAAKNVLILAIASIVYYCVGFGMAFGDGGNGFIGGSGFFPTSTSCSRSASRRSRGSARFPGAAGYLFEVAFAAVSLAIVWGAMAERTKLWVYFAFGACFTLIYSLVSHWIWSPRRLAVRARACRTSPARRSSTTRAPSPGSPGDPARPAARQVRLRREAERDPRPQHGVHDPRRDHPLVRLVRVQPGLDALGRLRRRRLLRVRRAEHEPRRAAGVLGAVVTSWIVVKKPDLSMMLNGAIAALVAITAACAFVAPWAAILIGFVSGIIVVVGSLLVERVGIDDPVGAIAAHGMSGVWGTLALGFLAVPELAEKLETGKGGLFYGGGFHQLGIQALGSPPSAPSRSPSRS